MKKLRHFFFFSTMKDHLKDLLEGINMIRLDGVYSALFSVYDENMNVKRHTVHSLMQFQREQGLRGFYICGNTGECTVLPNKTRVQMLEAVMEEKKDSTVIAHIGAGHFDDTAELLRHADQCGVDAIASLPPSLSGYYKNDEVIEYYKKLAAMTAGHRVYHRCF